MFVVFWQILINHKAQLSLQGHLNLKLTKHEACVEMLSQLNSQAVQQHVSLEISAGACLAGSRWENLFAASFDNPLVSLPQHPWSSEDAVRQSLEK